MKSKIEAARTALSSGVSVFIGTGNGGEKLIDMLEGKGDGTYIGNLPKQGIGQYKAVAGLK